MLMDAYIAQSNIQEITNIDTKNDNTEIYLLLSNPLFVKKDK